jgi:DNA-binding NarL/FixJ family response regulator
MPAGLGSWEIAALVNVNYKTIEAQRDRLYEKLGVTKATTLVQKSQQAGIDWPILGGASPTLPAP